MSAAAFSADDFRHMARALQLAEHGLYSTRPNPRVGCVLVKDGKVVGEGWHERAGGPHAEIQALKQAGASAAGSTCYVSLEPCCHHGRTPPCSEALLEARVSKVIAAAEDPNPQVAGAGLAQLREAGVQVQSGLLARASEALNVGFCQRMRSGRPWVRAKVAMSLDGRVAMASGESKWVTGEAARRDVQRWRARSCAVMTGVGTVLADDPALTVREAELLARMVDQPIRVVVDSRLRVAPQAAVFRGPGRAVVLTASPADESADALAAGGIEVVRSVGTDGRVQLSEALQELGRRQINEVLVEAGPTLTGALLQAGLVNELVCYVAPRLLGDAARPMARLPGVNELADSVDLRVDEVRQLGGDLRLILRPRASR